MHQPMDQWNSKHFLFWILWQKIIYCCFWVPLVTLIFLVLEAHLKKYIFKLKKKIFYKIPINRPGVARPVLQSPPSFINKLGHPLIKISSKYYQSQTGKARDLKFWKNVNHTLFVMCHASPVTCHMSCVMCHLSHVFKKIPHMGDTNSLDRCR